MGGEKVPVREAAKKAAGPKEVAEKPRRAAVAKMNFADLHALKTLPEKIAKADIRIAELEQALSDPVLYAKDPKRFAKLSDDMVTLRAQKDADEERWLALEMEREALENPG